jgi:peptidoglycan/xylan/chitin deacetylase (PgdA/CDA1 family)
LARINNTQISSFISFTFLVLLVSISVSGLSRNPILLLASSHKLSVHDTFKHKAGGKSQHLHHHSISGTDSRSTIDKTVSSNSNINTGNKTDKIIILTFGDTKKSQFTIAKPILDQYGFKASFFITCSYANDRDPRYHLNWNQILALQQDGQDIESKGMTPIDLNNISSSALA